MGKPIVAVVGRPNVGKSTLFNKLIGQRLAIVEDTPGVTRDRIFGECEWQNREFLLVDTGGIDPNEADGILAHIRQQAQVAIDAADCIVMVTDINAGVTAQDRDVAALLMRSGKPVVLAVNKCDKVGEPPMELYDFYSLGLGEVFPAVISGVTGFGFYAELENGVEGLVRLEALPVGEYTFDGVMTLAAPGVQYRVGDRVNVRCVRADVGSGQVDFVLGDENG